ncbi:MAG: pyruvate formate lyase-activating protein [Coriobacteriia bacterium]|nr:pyruvate formate lyase-activating protein [Coriobacteriia bacterium]
MSKGIVHSTEVGSFVDGPGIRFVVFLAGCPLRCQYCHNPDAWQCKGEPTEAEEVLGRIASSADFLKAGCGGVTLSGGEPLMQAEFAHEILEGSKDLGLHTALDTSGYLGDRLTDEMLEAIDLVLLDIKSYDPETYREVTGVDVEPTLRLAERLSELRQPAWIRFVLVPGLTDAPENVAGLARFVGRLANVQRVEILPFHQMGKHKWEELRLPYKLADTQPPTPEEVGRVRAVFEAQGLAVNDGRFATCGPVGAEA